ncbi:MAG: hypothetical protein Q9167_002155 [Letrouitia subvulpina]
MLSFIKRIFSTSKPPLTVEPDNIPSSADRMHSYLIINASSDIGLEFVQQLHLDKRNIVISLVECKADVEELFPKSRNFMLVEANVAEPKTLMSLVEDYEQNRSKNFRGFYDAVQAFTPLVRKGNEKKILILSLVSPFATPTSIIGDPQVRAQRYVNKAVAVMNNRLKKEGILIFVMGPEFIKTEPTSTNQCEHARDSLSSLSSITDALPRGDGFQVLRLRLAIHERRKYLGVGVLHAQSP